MTSDQRRRPGSSCEETGPDGRRQQAESESSQLTAGVVAASAAAMIGAQLVLIFALVGMGVSTGPILIVSGLATLSVQLLVLRRFYGPRAVLPLLGLNEAPVLWLIAALAAGALWPFSVDQWLQRLFGISETSISADPLLSDTPAAMLIVGGVLMSPIAEELFFRGVLFAWARNHIPWIAAAVVAAVPFAALHAQGPRPVAAIMAAMIFGVAAAAWYQASRSLWGAILLHVGNNSVAAFVLLI